MARINIEDSLYRDKRFVNLLMKLGNLDSAIGAMVRAWSLAQKWYCTVDKTIPMDAWREQDIPEEIIEVGLARIIAGRIQMRGADEQFSWLTQRVESGRKGGKAKALAVASGRLAGSDETYPLTLSPSPSLPQSPSLPPSQSLAHTQSQTQNNTNTVPKRRRTPLQTPDSTALNKRIWDAYVEAFRSRYKTDPVRNATTNAQVSQLGKRLGPDAEDVVRFYLSHNKAFYVQSCHAIGICLKDAEALYTQWSIGHTITVGEARNIDRTQTNTNAFLDYINESRKEKQNGGV